MHLQIAVLEDNQSDFQSLVSVIKEWAERTGNEVTMKHYEDENIVSAALALQYDIIFSDIELKNSPLTGMEICTKLREQGFHNEIIFTTAFKEYVFEGYNIQAFHFLLKPISLDTLSRCMQRFLEVHEKKHYVLQDRGNCTLLKYGDILYIEKQGHMILFHTASLSYGERTTISTTLRKLPAFFVPCHKSFVVNLHHIRSIIGSSLQLSNGAYLPIGRTHLSDIRKAMIDLSN